MSTDRDFFEEQELRDGTPVVLRHIRPEDADELRRGFEGLSAGSRQRRFLFAINTLTEELLEYLTNVDGESHVAIIATSRPGSPDVDPVGLGVARYVRLAEDPDVAEAAITVADEWQGKGLGRLLALTLTRAAQERGIKRFRGEIVADNEAVHGLLSDVGATFRDAHDGVTFEVELAELPLDPGSRLDVVVRKLLRAAATVLAGLFRGLRRD